MVSKDTVQKARTVLSVKIKMLQDDCPDTSYLEQEGFEERRADYMNDVFTFVGLRAQAEVLTPSTGLVTVHSSGGLWGIESDSGHDYLHEVAREELAQLREELAQCNVDLSNFNTLDHEWEG
jgi:hypothetical protein